MVNMWIFRRLPPGTSVFSSVASSDSSYSYFTSMASHITGFVANVLLNAETCIFPIYFCVVLPRNYIVPTTCYNTHDGLVSLNVIH